MPLDSPEAFERLAEHLKAVDPIIDKFVEQTPYMRQLSGVGRYPRRRVQFEEDGVWRAIDLTMELTVDDKYFEEFSPDLPYTLWGGAWIDIGADRYSDRGIRVLDHIPFAEVLSCLEESIWQCEKYLSEITKENLLTRIPHNWNIKRQ